MQTDPPEGDREPLPDEFIDADMSCIRCNYNLRGLKADGRCPECGTKIEVTVNKEFNAQRIWCPACYRPNHPTNRLCLYCREPMNPSVSDSDDAIDADMPCIRCQYNLRGLRPVGQCPECGTQIEKTMAFINQRVLCPICFQPNHPTNALCLNCKNPLTGSAATADYYRPKAMTPRTRVQADDEEEPESPSVGWIIMCWVFGLCVLTKLGFWLVSIWTEEPLPNETPGTVIGGRIFGTLFVLLIAVVPAAVMYFPLRSHQRLRREYLKKHAEFMAREAAADAREAEKNAAEGVEEES